MKFNTWQLTTIGEIVTFEGGSQPPKKFFSSEPRQNYVRLIQIRDYKTDKYATYIPKELAKKFCSFDDVMIGRYGPPIFQILRGLEGAYNVALIKATPSDKVTKDYLFYFLSQKNLFDLMEHLSQRSSGQTGVEVESLKKYTFPLPPKNEQFKIVKILQTCDRNIYVLENLIDAKARLKRGLAQQLLTGKKRFREFVGQEWKPMKIFEFTTFTPRVRPKPQVAFKALGIRSHGKGTFLKENFDPQKIEMTELFEVKENDLIVNITFAWEGAIAIVGKQDTGALVSHRFPTYEFKTECVIPEYFRYIIIQKWFVDKLGLISPGGAGRNRVLNKKDFVNIELLIPSLDEQRKIADVLNACDKEIELLNKQLEAIKKQKQGLMQKLLTGQIRVV